MEGEGATAMSRMTVRGYGGNGGRKSWTLINRRYATGHATQKVWKSPTESSDLVPGQSTALEREPESERERDGGRLLTLTSSRR